MKKKVLRRIAIILLVVLVLFCAVFLYAYFNGRSGLHPNPTPEEGDLRVACVGDSITYGSTVSNWPKNNYPVLLGKLLGEEYTVCNYGISGGCLLSTSDKPYMNTDVFPESIALNPDIVVIMLGTNDSKTNNWTSAEDFHDQLSSFIDEYSHLPSSPVIYLCTPCKAYSDAFSIHEENIAQILPVAETVAAEKNIPVIDIRSLSEANPEWFEKDGIHPGNDGAAAIAQAVCNAITNNR